MQIRKYIVRWFGKERVVGIISSSPSLIFSRYAHLLISHYLTESSYNYEKALRIYQRYLGLTPALGEYSLGHMGQYIHFFQEISPSSQLSFYKRILDQIMGARYIGSWRLERNLVALIESFRVDLAEELFEKEKKRLNLYTKRYFEFVIRRNKRNLEQIVSNSTFIPKVWENSFLFKFNARTAFYIPPVFRKSNIVFKGVHHSIIQFTESLFQELRNQKEVSVLFQFHWKAVYSVPDVMTFSYHTKGIGLDNIRFKESAFFGYFTLDPQGYAGWHSVNLEEDVVMKNLNNISLEEAKEFVKKKATEIISGGITKYESTTTDGNLEKLPDEFFFLPMQVEDDVVSRKAFIKTYELALACLDFSREYRVNLVIKRHPACKSVRVAELIRYANSLDNVYVSHRPIHEILSKCHRVVTVNSGVGFEAFLHGKEVIATGESDYSVACQKVKCREELFRILREPLSEKRTDIQNKYLYYFFKKYLHSIDDIRLGFLKKF